MWVFNGVQVCMLTKSPEKLPHYTQKRRTYFPDLDISSKKYEIMFSELHTLCFHLSSISQWQCPCSRRRQDLPQDISQYVDPKPLSRRPIFLMTCRGELGFPYKTNADMSGREGVKRGWGSMSSLRLNIFKAFQFER